MSGIRLTEEQDGAEHEVRNQEAPKKWEDLTINEQVSMLRGAVSDLNHRLNKASGIINMLVDRVKAEEMQRRIVSGAGVKIPGVRV